MGDVALAALALSAIGFAVASASSSADLRKHLARLEEQLEDHLLNGITHERRNGKL